MLRGGPALHQPEEVPVARPRNAAGCRAAAGWRCGQTVSGHRPGCRSGRRCRPGGIGQWFSSTGGDCDPTVMPFSRFLASNDDFTRPGFTTSVHNAPANCWNDAQRALHGCIDQSWCTYDATLCRRLAGSRSTKPPLQRRVCWWPSIPLYPEPLYSAAPDPVCLWPWNGHQPVRTANSQPPCRCR